MAQGAPLQLHSADGASLSAPRFRQPHGPLAGTSFLQHMISNNSVALLCLNMACLPTSLQCLWSGHSHSGFHGSYFSFPLFHLQTSPLNLGLIPQLCRPLLVLSSIVLIRGLPYPVIFFISKVVFFLLEVPYYKIHLCTLDHFSLYTHF